MSDGGALCRAALLGAYLTVALARAADAGSLQERIRAADAGATLRVPAGVHAGPLVIDRSLRLLGEGGAVIEGDGRGHVIAITAPDVEVAGLQIRRSGSDLSGDDAGIHVSAPRAYLHHNTIADTLHGIYLHQASGCRIVGNIVRGRAAAAAIDDPLTRGLNLRSAELCSVELAQDRRGNGIHIWNCGDHTIDDNDIRGTRDGIYFSFCDHTTVRHNTIREVRYGLHYMYSDGNRFEENLFAENAAGAALMYSRDIVLRRNRFLANRSHRAYGLLLHTVEATTIAENTIEGNTIGIFLESGVGNTFAANTIAANYIGVRLSGSSDGNRFADNRFLRNVHSVETNGAADANTWSVAGRGNFWEGALALDLDDNGIADVPHREADLFGGWRRAFPEIGLLSGSPGARAVRFVHARIGVPGLDGVRDPEPLVRTESP
ncbi:MAG: NosD domain-containing protein [Opitutaceae bacterium]